MSMIVYYASCIHDKEKRKAALDACLSVLSFSCLHPSYRWDCRHYVYGLSILLDEGIPDWLAVDI